MVTADFWSHLWQMPHDQREEYLMGLAKLKLEGMPYTRMEGFLGFPASQISRHVKPYLATYREFVNDNFAKLEQSLRQVDPDYEYMVDQRTIQQQMCALLMGGQEIIDTLEQLAGVQNELVKTQDSQLAELGVGLQGSTRNG
jgi:hypothetical protein